MIVTALVVAGVVAFPSLGVDRYPRTDLPTVFVRTPYPGAGVSRSRVGGIANVESECGGHRCWDRRTAIDLLRWDIVRRPHLLALIATSTPHCKMSAMPSRGSSIACQRQPTLQSSPKKIPNLPLSFRWLYRDHAVLGTLFLCRSLREVDHRVGSWVGAVTISVRPTALFKSTSMPNAWPLINFRSFKYAMRSNAKMPRCGWSSSRRDARTLAANVGTRG